ncbi:MAG: amidophosphoribosyltransferase [Alphaproteobacteria bacterium]|nr:amidophosphoribosyltransferase [Alphaproteobacteria bacterium]
MISTDPFDDDKLHEECGVFGIINHGDAAAYTALGLHALQHRGQEAAGIVSTDGGQFFNHTALGKVGDNFNSQEVMARLVGHAAIGHVRYSTAGGKHVRNIQPIFAEFEFGGFAVAHNGNLTNALTLRKELVARGSIFQTSMDTETVIHLMATSTYNNVLDQFIDALRRIEGAYSIVALDKNRLYAARDSLGIRPLVIGKLDNSYVVASETCALDIIGAEFVRDVEPGEVVVIENGKVASLKPFREQNPRFCIFEYIYFARPDSIVEGRHVYEMRKQIGIELAKEANIQADLVVPVPDSGVPAALGFSEQSGIPFELGIIRNHYVGRTFIEPTDHVRHLGVKLKHNVNGNMLRDKRVVLVDDSIVRGTTSKKIVDMVRNAGAKEVHMCISSPPTVHSCFYGVDTPEEGKLLAARYSMEEMAKIINVDSLTFISVDGLYRAIANIKRDKKIPQFCDACFTGDYPTLLRDKHGGVMPLFESLAFESKSA